MAGVRYEFRVSGLISDRARDAFSDMIVQPVPPESIIFAHVVDEAHLRELLALCSALGLELISLQQLPAAGGSVTRDGEGDPAEAREVGGASSGDAAAHPSRIR
jgi:hypothetical protein